MGDIMVLAGVFLSDCNLQENYLDDLCLEDHTGLRLKSETGLKSASGLRSRSETSSRSESQSESGSEFNSDSESSLIENVDVDEIPDLYNNENIDNYQLLYDSTKTFNPLPNWFYNPKQWVKSTNLICWRCGLTCYEHPWFIPLTKIKKLIPIDLQDELIIEDKFVDCSDAALINSKQKYKEIIVFKPYGVFCSPWCAMSRINKENDPKIINKWQTAGLLREVYKIFTGKTVKTIPEAYYPKEIMEHYCGNKDGVTPHEYRQMNNTKAYEMMI